MRTVTMASLKGGVGKTTLAINLAVCAHQNGFGTALIDLDPNQSTHSWAKRRKLHQGKVEPNVASVIAEEVHQVHDTVRRRGGQLLLIDTRGDGETGAREAIRHSDLTLVPARPSILDLEMAEATVRSARYSSDRVVVVLSACDTRRKSLVEDARQWCYRHKLAVALPVVYHRAPINDALVVGLGATELEPGSKAAEDIVNLWEWVALELGMPAQAQTEMEV